MAFVDSAPFDASDFPLMDPSITQGLRAALGDGVDMIISKTTGLIDQRLSSLASLSGSPLDADLARIAHEIGGMAGQIGLTRLAQTALALERASKGGDADGASALLSELVEIAVASKAQLGV